MTILVGAACVMIDQNYVRHAHNNFCGTTVRKLQSMEYLDRRKWLLALVMHNLEALKAQLIHIASLPPRMRMWRISSDLLPIATHSVTREFYEDREVEDYISNKLARCGLFARKHGIRLSFHPAQYVVLGSKNPGIRDNAIRELVYHADVFTRMGYTGDHQGGTAINVHVGPKEAAVKEMRTLLKRSPKNILQFLTLENDEFSWSARAIVENFGDMVPVVLDIHHYWIMHERRVNPKGQLVQDIRATWRGVQPKLHHALSAPELCGDIDLTKSIDLAPLLEQGKKKAHLRAHSLNPWHSWSNSYAASFGFDLLWEGKDKNIGAEVIARQLKIL